MSAHSHPPVVFNVRVKVHVLVNTTCSQLLTMMLLAHPPNGSRKLESGLVIHEIK